MQDSPRPSDATQTGAERLERETNGRVGFDSHRLQYVEELPALAGEKSVCGEACDGSDGATESIAQRTNDCDVGEVGADEFTRDGKDEAGLNQVGWLERWAVEEVGEGQAGYGVLQRRDGLLHSITGEVDPFEKVSDLVSANAKGDLKHFRIGHFLTHGCVET